MTWVEILRAELMNHREGPSSEALAIVDALEHVVESTELVQTGLGLTAYEGTSISAWSARHYERTLGKALQRLYIAGRQ